MFWQKKKTFADHLSANWPVIVGLFAMAYGYGQLQQTTDRLTEDVSRIERILLEGKMNS